MDEPHQSAHFTVTSPLAAYQLLLEVLQDARETTHWYRFSGLSVPSILTNGLTLEGQISEISEKISLISGVRHADS